MAARMLESKEECAVVLYLMAACRGALNGLMAELIATFGFKSSLGQARAAEELIAIVKAYLK